MASAQRRLERRDRWYRRRSRYREERKYRYRHDQRERERKHRSERGEAEAQPGRLAGALSLLVVLLGLVGCSERPAAAAALVRAAPTAAAAEASAAERYDTRRLVVLGASLTETVFALGAGERVVGVDSTSLHPERALKLPKVGFHRQLSAEGVLELEPTLVILSSQTGPRLAREQLAAAGVPTLTLGEEPTLPALRERIRTLGRVLEREAEARALTREIDAELAHIESVVAGVEAKPRVLFVYARGQGTPYVAGRATTPAALIALAGGEPAVSEFSGYRPLTSEGALLAAPEHLVLPARGLDSVGGASALLATPGLHATPAGRAGRVIGIEDAKILSVGPRVAEGVRELARALHPSLDATLARPSERGASGGPS